MIVCSNPTNSDRCRKLTMLRHGGISLEEDAKILMIWKWYLRYCRYSRGMVIRLLRVVGPITDGQVDIRCESCHVRRIMQCFYRGVETAIFLLSKSWAVLQRGGKDRRAWQYLVADLCSELKG